jgi:hypothetical protein
MTATYQVLETRRPADHLILGYLSVNFAFTDQPTLTVNPACSSSPLRTAPRSATTKYPASTDADLA